MSKFQLFNGEFVLENKAVLQTSNRGFCYGDGFFESMRVANGKPYFVAAHWKRIQRTAEFLRIQIPHLLTERSFGNLVIQLCERNKFKNARVRFQAFRNGRGKYTPESDELGWSMSCQELPTAEYQLNEKGLRIGVCRTHRINPKPQSSYKTSNSLPYVLGGMHAQEMNWDDSLMLDSEGFIAESTNSNLFLIKDQTVITPNLSNGGVNGVMRSVVIGIAPKAGFEVKEELVSVEDVLGADECFLTNAVRGMQWVGALERKRYFKKKTGFLLQQVNNSPQS